MEQIRDAVARVAARYARRCWWADRDDLTQEGLRAALEARQTWDPAVGVPEAYYCARAASRALSSYLFRVGSPVSASDGEVAALAGLYHEALPEALGTKEDPEGDLDGWRWHRDVRDLLAPLLRDHDDLLPGVLVVYDGERSSEVARKLGLDVDEVYRSADRFRDSVRASDRLWRLWYERCRKRSD